MGFLGTLVVEVGSALSSHAYVVRRSGADARCIVCPSSPSMTPERHDDFTQGRVWSNLGRASRSRTDGDARDLPCSSTTNVAHVAAGKLEVGLRACTPHCGWGQCASQELSRTVTWLKRWPSCFLDERTAKRGQTGLEQARLAFTINGSAAQTLLAVETQVAADTRHPILATKPRREASLTYPSVYNP